MAFSDAADSLFVGVPTSGVATNQYGPTLSAFPRGTICKARYLFPHKDPTPCILVLGPDKHGNLAGINLRWIFPHFLAETLNMLAAGGVSYLGIKARPNILDGYRTYKVKGLRNVRVLDTSFMQGLLQAIRRIHPTEIKAIQQEIDKQMAQRLNPSAAEMAGPATPAPTTPAKSDAATAPGGEQPGGEPASSQPTT